MAKPWDAETDSLDFEEAGLPCAMRRGPSGHWCGYVGVPSGHALHGVGYNDPIKSPPKALVERSIDVDKVGAINVFCAGRHGVNPEELCDLVLLIDVHGGLTYAADKEPHGKADGLWWFGFDCAHAGDLTPKHEADRHGHPDYTYRDAAYTEAETRSLARQLADWPAP